MKLFEDIDYAGGNDPRQKLDLYLPENEEFDLFLYFHGGGLTGGNYKGYKKLAGRLTDAGIAFASAEYRMFPEAQYPDFIEDAAAAAAFLKAHISEYGKCRRMFVGGSSAGGYLSMMLCFDKRYLGKYGLSPMDFGYVHDAGQPTAHFNCLKFRGLDSRRVIVDETAPLYYIGLSEQIPEMLFIWSDNDMQNRPEQLTLTVSTLKHFGYDMSRVHTLLMHGSHCAYIGKDPDAFPVFVNAVIDFIRNAKG